MINLIWEFGASWELFAEAVWTSLFAGAVLGAVGVFMVLLRLPFLTAALAQTAGLGVAASYWLNAAVGLSFALSPQLGALSSTLIAAWWLGQKGAQEEAQSQQLAVLYLLGTSLTLAIVTRLPHEVGDIEALLFGSAVAAAPGDAAHMMWILLAFGSATMCFLPGLTEMLVDPSGARVRGAPVGALGLGLIASVALVIAAATQSLGALPVFGLTVLPPLSVLPFANSLQRALAAAASVGALCAGVGYFVAFALAWPVGASQTLIALFCFALSTLLGSFSAQLAKR